MSWYLVNNICIHEDIIKDGGIFLVNLRIMGHFDQSSNSDFRQRRNGKSDCYIHRPPHGFFFHLGSFTSLPCQTQSDRSL